MAAETSEKHAGAEGVGRLVVPGVELECFLRKSHVRAIEEREDVSKAGRAQGAGWPC